MQKITLKFLAIFFCLSAVFALSLVGCASGHSAKQDLFYECFTSYKIGDQVPLWGEKTYIVSDADYVKWIGNTKERRYIISKDIDFPQNFMFEFLSSGAGSAVLTFISNDYKTIRIDLGTYISIDGGERVSNKAVQEWSANNININPLDKNVNTKYTFKFKGNTMECYVFGIFVTSKHYPDITKLSKIRISMPDSWQGKGSIRFTRFKLSAL